MADEALTVVGAGPGAASPVAYTVPGAGEVFLKGAFARMDGTGTASAWFPCVRVKTPNGAIMLECLGSSVAAGASADVTWFPGVKDTTTGGGGGSGIQFATSPQSGTWLDITTTGADAAGNGWTVEDDGGGGWTFLTKNGGNFGPAMYIKPAAGAADGLTMLGVFPTSVNGNTVGTDSEAVSTGTGSPTGVIGFAQVANGGLGTGVSAQAVTNGTGPATGLSATAQKSGGGTGTVKAIQGFVPSNAAGDFVLYCQSNVGGGGSTVPIFEVRADGTIHALTGGSIHFDL